MRTTAKIMRTSVKKVSQEEGTIASLHKSLDKLISRRNEKICIMEKRIIELGEKIVQYRSTRDEYVDLYDIIHTMTKREAIYHPIISSFLQHNIIKLFQLSPDGIKWLPWKFNMDEIESKMDELIFHVPVKQQLCRHIMLHEKHCIQYAENEIIKSSKRIETLTQEKKSLKLDIKMKINYEQAFIDGNVQTVFIRIINMLNHTNKHIWNNVYSSRIITPSQLRMCISMMKLFNEPRIQLMFNKFIDSTPESVADLTSSHTLIIMGVYKKMIRTHLVMNKIHQVVEFLYTKRPNSIRDVSYKQFIAQHDKFKEFHKLLWVNYYVNTISFIQMTPTFSDILVNKIYEYLY
jgi:hypothetical protein